MPIYRISKQNTPMHALCYIEAGTHGRITRVPVAHTWAQGKDFQMFCEWANRKRMTLTRVTDASELKKAQEWLERPKADALKQGVLL